MPSIKYKDKKTGKFIRIPMYSIGGSGEDKTFVYSQLSASNKWIINHNLDKFPSVTVVDSAGTVVFGNVVYIDKNQLTIDFSSEFSGKAYLN